jgi:pyruvate dehydrogenase E2 component (dihydrolipoamide acetyltransferase)
MAVDFILPDLGEGIQEAEILKILVSEGQAVKEDQPIFEVETDKAVVEIPSPHAGTIEKVHVTVGEMVTVGSAMVSYNLGQEKAASSATKSQSAAAESKADAAAEKAAATSSSKSEKGATTNNAIPTNAGSASAKSASAAPANSGNGKSTVTPAQSHVFAEGQPVPCAPATRRLARELGVDLRLIKGSGPGNRVLNEDVTGFAAGGGNAPPSKSISTGTNGQKPAVVKEAPLSLSAKYGSAGESESARGSHDFGQMAAQPVDLPDFSKFGPVERIPLKSLRRKIAINMTQAWTHIPHVTICDEVDVTELDALRARYETMVKEMGGRLTLTVFMLKALVSGLKKYPQFNSSLDEKTGEIVFKHYYNMGVAVATDRGLIVPVIKDVDKKSIVELSSELADIAEKTRSGKIELERLHGGTFTVTNIGSIGGTSMSPMINFPEAAILGMARAALKPVVRDGNIVVRLILPLALAFDHRIADGAEAAYFVQHIVKKLQEPFTFVLEA